MAAGHAATTSQRLTNVYTADDLWVAPGRSSSFAQHVGDPSTMRALGFCVSVAHARFMADEFNKRGIAAAAVWGDTPDDERRPSPATTSGAAACPVLFTVDLFNEGVDVPERSTRCCCCARPRARRSSSSSSGAASAKPTARRSCTVLDFVGPAPQGVPLRPPLPRPARRDSRGPRAQIERDFPFLPAGCHMELDQIARKVVLDSIKSAIPSNFPQRVAELRSIGDVSLAEFLDESGLELTDIYAGSRTWSDLRRAAGFLPPAPETTYRTTFSRALGRLLHTDDDERIGLYSGLVAGESRAWPALSAREQRAARMLLASLYHQHAPSTEADALAELGADREICDELADLMAVLRRDVTHTTQPLDPAGPVPLHVHARYTRREIQAAFADGTSVIPPRWDSGVKWLPTSRSTSSRSPSTSRAATFPRPPDIATMRSAAT